MATRRARRHRAGVAVIVGDRGMMDETNAAIAPNALAGLPESERTLLIVDDDAPLCQRLARAMERSGFVVTAAESLAAGIDAATRTPPAFAVVDLRLGDVSGLVVVKALRQARPSARVVILTGYGNIATAVAAVKVGALDYLPKPADADAVEAALLATEATLPPPPADPMSADRVRWEHIQRVFEQCDRNVSETARRLEIGLGRAEHQEDHLFGMVGEAALGFARRAQATVMGAIADDATGARQNG